MPIVIEGAVEEPEEAKPLGWKNRIVKFDWNKILHEVFPVTRWLFNYNLQDLPYDIVAGFTVGLTLVPQCLSYAAICNVRPEFGLYTSFFGQFIYFIFGSSRHGSVGPTAITSMMMGMVNGMFNPLVDQGDNTYNALIVFISGIILVGMGLLRLGFIVSLFSIPVVSGFTSAAGFVILGSQVKLFFGLKWAPNDSPGTFVKQMKNIYDRRAEIKPMDCLCGVLVMITLFSFQYTPVLIAKIKEWRAKGQPIPPPGPNEARFMRVLNILVASRNVVVFVISTGVAYHFYRQDPEGLPKKLSLVGFIKPGLPTWQFPATSIIANRTVLISSDEALNMTNGTFFRNNTGYWTTKEVTLKSMSEIINDLSAYIIIIPLMTMLENLAITKALARKNGTSVNATNELIGVGISNFLQSFINAFPCTTTISRCALNDQCQVRTQLASLISATIVIITLVALTPIFYFIPKPCLAGIMICAGYNLLDWNIVIHMWHECKRDVVILLGAFVLCLFYDIAYGILICILLNMVVFLRPIIMLPLHVSQRPMIMRNGQPSDKHFVTVIKIPHGMEYPSCDRFIEEMSLIFASSEDQNIVVDCQFIHRLDYSGVQAFRALVMMAFRLKKHAIFSNLSDSMARQFEELGIEHFNYVDTIDEAIKGRHWASKLSLNSGEASMPHISSVVLNRGPSMLRIPSSMGMRPGASMARLGAFPSRARLGSSSARLGPEVPMVQINFEGAEDIEPPRAQQLFLPADLRPNKSQARLNVARSMAKIGIGSPSTNRLSDQANAAIPTINVEAEMEAEEQAKKKLFRPVSTRDLGTAWQHDGGLFSASLASTWIVANVAPTDDQTIKDWQKSAMARKLSARGSMNQMAQIRNSIQQGIATDDGGAELGDYTYEEEEYLRQQALNRRKSSGIDFSSHGRTSIQQAIGFPAPPTILIDDEEAAPQRRRSSAGRRVSIPDVPEIVIQEADEAPEPPKKRGSKPSLKGAGGTTSEVPTITVKEEIKKAASEPPLEPPTAPLSKKMATKKPTDTFIEEGEESEDEA